MDEKKSKLVYVKWLSVFTLSNENVEWSKLYHCFGLLQVIGIAGGGCQFDKVSM